MNHIPKRSPLPVDALLPDLFRNLETRPSMVLTAEPGAGKTTRVPPALLTSPWLGDKQIWVLQPRRIAAKMAAVRVASELGETPGQQVGYHFRFEKKTGPATRLVFMTDGMLIPLAQSDPELSRVGAVVLDEFHERSLSLDLGLAWLKNLQQTRRPDLKILVMSATLDSVPLSQYLSGCPILQSPGRVFPVSVEYQPFPGQRDLSEKVRSAVRLLVARGLQGTYLVFLPGLAEIRRSLQALSGDGLEVCPLYGDLSLEEQQKALLPSKGIKVILSTNLAETSLTVPGATAVIDVGLNRQARVSPWSGLERLVTVPASQASAAQRAGRAGRLGPGTCLRLFTQFDFEHRAAFDLPEISRSDLAKSLLDLKGLFPGSLEAFPWFLPPPTPALDSAQTLLRDLGALDASGVLTTLGRHMAKLPLTVRLARFLLAVQELAPKESPALSWACRLAALLQTEESISVDFLEELRTPPRSYETQHLEEQLAGNLRVPPAPKGAPHHEIINHLSRGLLLAFPDRVAKIRESAGSKSRDKRGNQRELVMAQGGSVTAPDGALTRSHDLFLVVEAQESGDRGQARALSLCPIEEDWLLDFFPGNLREEKALEWNSTAQRMEGSNRLCYRQLVLEEKPLAPGEFGKEGKEFLYREALAAGPAAYADPEELTAFLNRLRFIGERAAKNMIPEKELIEETLRNLCEGRRSFADLKSAGLVEALRGGLPPQSLELLEKLAPASVPLASGRRMAVHYEEGKPPWGESRIQDFFGLREGPKVGGGEVAVILHLLSPAKRAVQITSDLAGFWERHYPALRKEFSRRYPRHKWPENPLA